MSNNEVILTEVRVDETQGLNDNDDNDDDYNDGGSLPRTASQSKMPLFAPRERKTFYDKHVEPWMEKGFLSNSATFCLMIIGAIWTFADDDSVVAQFVLSFGLFGFSGGFTNWLAIKMLFDRVPGLYGSGVIPKRFKEIRETVKNTIMRTFFDSEYLEKYLNQKAGQLAGSLHLEEKIKELLESPAVDQVIDTKLMELGTRPEGMFLAMMGINPTSLKPMVKPFVLSMGSEFVPLLTSNFKISNFISIDKIRSEIDSLMTTKLQELTPETVKRLLEDVIREHLGWLVVWGNVFGGAIGIISKIVELVAADS